MEKFNLNDQFDMYLQRVGLDKTLLSNTQYTELKRAFIGAAGQMLVMFRDYIGGIENEGEAISVMESLFIQVGEFWKTQL